MFRPPREVEKCLPRERDVECYAIFFFFYFVYTVLYCKVRKKKKQKRAAKLFNDNNYNRRIIMRVVRGSFLKTIIFLHAPLRMRLFRNILLFSQR